MRFAESCVAGCAAWILLSVAAIPAASAGEKQALDSSGKGMEDAGTADAAILAAYPQPTEVQEAVIAASIRLLSSDDFRARNAAVQRLVAVGDAAVRSMVKALESASDPDFKLRLRYALARLDWMPEEAFRRLLAEGVEMLVNPPRADEQAPLTGDSARRENESLFARMAKTRENLVRQGRRLLPAIGALLERTDYRYRRLAAELIAGIGERHRDRRTVALLIKALEDPGKDTYVEENAAEGLRRLTGIRWPSFEKRKWREWWAASGKDFEFPAAGGGEEKGK